MTGFAGVEEGEGDIPVFPQKEIAFLDDNEILSGKGFALEELGTETVQEVEDLSKLEISLQFTKFVFIAFFTTINQGFFDFPII